MKYDFSAVYRRLREQRNRIKVQSMAMRTLEHHGTFAGAIRGLRFRLIRINSAIELLQEWEESGIDPDDCWGYIQAPTLKERR